MTIITVEIDKDKDLSELKEFIDRLGLTYKVEENSTPLYTDEFKSELDKRHDEYLKDSVTMISAKESKQRIQQLLSAGK